MTDLGLGPELLGSERGLKWGPGLLEWDPGLLEWGPGLLASDCGLGLTMPCNNEKMASSTLVPFLALVSKYSISFLRAKSYTKKQNTSFKKYDFQIAACTSADSMVTVRLPTRSHLQPSSNLLASGTVSLHSCKYLSTTAKLSYKHNN